MEMKWAFPVWEQGKETEMNWFISLKTELTAGAATIRITACNLYRVLINGEFVCQGPARAGHTCYRVDEMELTPWLSKGGTLEIQAGAYNVNGFEYLDEPGFVQCEIERNGEMLAATGVSGFTGFSMKSKLQKVQRFSFQRMFCEEYRLPAEEEQIELAVQPVRNLIDRGIPMEKWETVEITDIAAAGTADAGHPREQYYQDRQIDKISPVFKGYTKDELGTYLNKEVEEIDFASCEIPEDAMSIDQNSYRIFDMKTEYTGYIGVNLTVREPAVLYLLFDELLVEGDVKFYRLGCTAAVKYELKPGSYKLLTIQPYGFRYLKIVAMKGSVKLNRVYLRKNEYSLECRPYTGTDPELKEIYDAAVNTFRQNAPDIFMDCPTRERAGWLCDSFFTGRAEFALTGKNEIEHNFLENFLHTEHYPFIKKGMFPMCYPSDHYNEQFIPNWAMFLVLELEEYGRRTGDRDLPDRFKKRVYDLIQYFKTFENEFGLLEDLEKWVMVEWSKCGELTKGVNYPTNMLYYRMLCTASRMYQDDMLKEKAEKLKDAILTQGFNGKFFADQSLRKDGKLELGKDITETCQYYAFFSGAATPESHPELWKTMTEKFGPDRKDHNEYPEVYFSNAFIGTYLRLDALAQAGRRDQVIQESRKYFLSMARTTGTLWEHLSPMASCNHGFASTVVCWLQ